MMSLGPMVFVKKPNVPVANRLSLFGPTAFSCEHPASAANRTATINTAKRVFVMMKSSRRIESTGKHTGIAGRAHEMLYRWVIQPP